MEMYTEKIMVKKFVMATNLLGLNRTFISAYLKRKCFVLALVLYCSEAIACIGVPLEVRTHPDELIERTPTIIFALVVSAHWQNNLAGFELPSIEDYEFPANAQLANYQIDVPRVEYSFYPLKTLKGEAPEVFKLNGDIVRETSFTSHDNHSDNFITNSEGRIVHMSCKIIPSFVVGGTYLLFLDDKQHIKGYEYIPDYFNDEWFKYVDKKTQK